MSQGTSSTIFSLVILSVCAALGLGQLGQADGPQSVDHYLLHESCGSALNEQIGLELYASIVYLNMAAYFDRPVVARAGYAKFFRDQSLEEYNHASKFIEYINKRNGTVKSIAVEESPKSEWSSPREALNDAIRLEKLVYAKLRHIHDLAEQKCDDDQHLTDYLESYFFTEQVDSIHELQVLLSKLENSNKDPASGSLVEYLEDKVLLKGKSEM